MQAGGLVRSQPLEAADARFGGHACGWVRAAGPAALSTAPALRIPVCTGGLIGLAKFSCGLQDNVDVRLAGIGGLSEFLGWTTVQRESSKQMGAFGGWENLLKVVSVASKSLVRLLLERTLQGQMLSMQGV